MSLLELRAEVALLRKQVRNAWAKLGCRCIFNDRYEMTHQDDHCPYHGTYQRDAESWDPIGELQADLARVTAEREHHRKAALHHMGVSIGWQTRAEQAEAAITALEQRATEAEAAHLREREALRMALADMVMLENADDSIGPSTIRRIMNTATTLLAAYDASAVDGAHPEAQS